ncbi:MAG: polysaccharide biosynthesis protein, partial [Pseudomonadota bacterium]|nr:polysaccharide biosynthesis protein [Pseudomonadota bacterium]
MTLWFYAVLRRLRHGLTVFSYDALVIPIAWLGAFWLRFNLDTIPDGYWLAALAALPIVMALQIAVYWGFGLYRGIWRFASLPDLLRIIKAAAVGMLLAAVSLLLINRLTLIPRSVFPLYGILLVMMLGGARFFARWFKDYGRLLQGQRVLIVGAGDAGEGIVRDLIRQQHQYRPVAFVDDKPENEGKEIQGVRVAGQIDELPQLVHRYSVDLVIIALPSVKADVMRRVVELCESVRVE